MTRTLSFLFVVSASFWVGASPLLAPRQASVQYSVIAPSTNRVWTVLAARRSGQTVTQWWGMISSSNLANTVTVNVTNSASAPAATSMQLSWTEPITLQTSTDLASWTNLATTATRSVSLPVGSGQYSVRQFFRVPLQIQDATLRWEPSPSFQVVGYKIHYGRALGAYDGLIDAGLATSWTLTGLLPGSTYYFFVTAYDGADTESPASNIICYTAPVVEPVTDIRTAR